MKGISHTAVIICSFAACVCARVDSMDIGDNTMQWRSFVTDEPAVAFAESGGRLWYATASGTGYYTMSTNVKSVVMQLGELSAAGVTDMVADKGSGVWIGTGEGLAYTTNGSSFKVFTSKNGLAGSKVTCLHVSGDGALWAGTTKGVSVYRNGSWTSHSSAQGLAGDNVRDITSSDDGKVFVATNRGIGVYSGGQWTVLNQASGMSSNDVKAVGWDGRKLVLWAAVGDGGVNSYDGKEWNDFMDVQDDITDIMSDTQSRIWVGSASGIIKYNGFEWIYDPAKMPFPASTCNRMYRDEAGNLWFAIDTGVMKLNNPYPY